MENKQMKCIKGESCLHCGSNYCRFVDEIEQLKAKNEELKKNLNEGCLQHLTLMTEQRVLLKTFAEIKEIAERDKLVCESCSERYTDGCIGYKDFENDGDCTHCGNGARADLAKQILQKISESEANQ